MESNGDEPDLVLDQSPRLRRSKSRDVKSRFQSPGSPSTRKPRAGQLEDSLRGLWPSASASKADTLGDHLGNERLNDILERNRALFLDRGRSSRSGFSSKCDRDTKENLRPAIGGSMRYTGSPRFSAKSSASKVFSNSVDDMAPFSTRPARRASEEFPTLATGASDLGEACSSAYSRAKKNGIDVASKYMTETPRHRRGTSESNSVASEAAQKAMKRVNSLTASYGSSKSQWAMSPGRSDSPRVSAEGKGGALPSPFSSLKPRGSPKSKGVEKLLNMGLDLFKSRRSSSSSFSSPISSPAPAVTISRTGQEYRLLYNGLMQWRFANAKADLVNANVANQVERKMVCAWDSVTKLQRSVAHKRIQLHREKLEMKLNFILQSQLKLLEGWVGMERQHSVAITEAKESLHNVVCKIPLIEGAKVDIESAPMTFRHALDLGSSIKSVLTTFSPTVEKNVELMSELARVVAQERLLMEEFVLLVKDISILEIKERSLKCSIIQMELWKQHSNTKCEQD